MYKKRMVGIKNYILKITKLKIMIVDIQFRKKYNDTNIYILDTYIKEMLSKGLGWEYKIKGISPF